MPVPLMRLRCFFFEKLLAHVAGQELARRAGGGRLRLVAWHGCGHCFHMGISQDYQCDVLIVVCITHSQPVATSLRKAM